MGDSGHNRHGPKRGEGLLCLFRGELGPHLIQCGLGRGLLPYTKCRLHPSSRLATIDVNQKLGDVPLLCSRLATIDVGRKLGGAPPLLG